MKAIDKHCNIVLENVKVMQTKIPKSRKGKKSKSVNKDPYIFKRLLGRASVITVLQNPLTDGLHPVVRNHSAMLQRPVLNDGNNTVLCFFFINTQIKF